MGVQINSLIRAFCEIASILSFLNLRVILQRSGSYIYLTKITAIAEIKELI